ncbi:MAG TPA: YkgJ family cysteine cluster protein [Bryobacteraceae bacterium]|nr:YkgJ family cysteine cluster protein [Bryobacteraceae bacterium]
MNRLCIQYTAEQGEACQLFENIPAPERYTWLLDLLRFECQSGCIKCCEQQGFVYLTEDDLTRLAAFVKMSPRAFERRYVYRTKHLRRLRVPRHAQCIFLKSDGCSVHPAKPLQCRTFPFWPELVDDKREWLKTGHWCPGIGKGELVNIQTAREIAQTMRDANPLHY